LAGLGIAAPTHEFDNSGFVKPQWCSFVNGLDLINLINLINSIFFMKNNNNNKFRQLKKTKQFFFFFLVRVERYVFTLFFFL